MLLRAVRVRLWLWWGMLASGFPLSHTAWAQVLPGAMPVVRSPHGIPAPNDTTLLLAARARRVGLNTYVQSSTARGQLALGARQLLRYRLGSEWIYDDRGTPPFIREDYAADIAHIYLLDAAGHWQIGQQLHYDQSRANATRTGLWQGRLGYQHLLHPKHDSLSQFRLTALAGLATDTRNGRHDSGLAYGLDAAVIFFLNGPTVAPLAARILANQAWLGPRTVQRLVAEAGGEQVFLPNSALSIVGRVGYRQNRAEDYLLGSVQRIQSDTLAVQAGGTYRLNPFATLRSDNSILLPTRAFHYRRQAEATDTLQDVGYRQRELETRQELRMAGTKLQSTISFLYRERRRSYYLENSRNLTATRLAAALAREQVKDIIEQTTRWQGDLTWLLTPRHSVAVLATAQLLRVDAPSKDNQQTRDEAQHLLRLTWNGRWAGAFRTTLGLAGEYRQTIFIRAAQSAENYTDHLLHWEPGFTWAPGRFSIRSQYHLWVSYQVRDKESEQARNRASRVLEQTQSISYQLRPNLLLLADYVRRENRIGQLDWTRFRESPLDTSITHDFSASARRSWTGPRGIASLRLGYRLLEQRSYGRALLQPDDATTSRLIFLHSITRQQGPEVAIERHAVAGLTLSASLWLQWLYTYYAYTLGTGTTTASSYTAAELARATRRVLPYFEINVAWQPPRRPRG